MLLIALSLGESSRADDSPFKDNWVVSMEAEKLDRQFMYTGSSLDQVAKITVKFYRVDQPDQKTLYEMLWFNDGKPIGLERKNDFTIPAGRTTKIQVTNKKGTTPATEKAIADAIMRLSVDAYRNRTAIISTKVPQESYQGVVQALHQLKCTESNTGADEAEKALMDFSIETDVEGGPSTILYYY
jgi:hypothetical protein